MGDTGKGHILLVEDDAGVLALERLKLVRSGYTVTCAASIEEALVALEDATPDLLVVDYQLQGTTTGLDLFRQLNGREKNIPAVLVTGFSDENRVVEALRAGVRDVISKTPAYLDYLPEAVERVLHQVRAERQLVEAEAASREKDRFLAMLSHELRTPLAPVLMNLCALENSAEIPAHQREIIAMMRRNVEMEVRLIDDLLDISRISHGKLHLDKRPVSIRTPLSQAVSVCHADAVAKQLKVDVQIPQANDTVLADEIRLQQVFWNLLRNAIKFTPQGGSIRVRAETSPNGDRIIITVADTGMGISGELLSRIFNPFEQAREAQSFGGLGLGLAICKNLIELHDGTIRVESPGTPGGGATFTVELPLTIPSSASTIPAPSRNMLPSEPFTPGLRILLVEDHVDSGKTLTRLLEVAGFQVKWAKSTAEASDLARNHAFDLVVSDLSLPDGNGYDLMRTLRGRHGLTGIAMSGYGMEDDIRRSREAGFAEHVVKPVSVERLQQSIRRVAASQTTSMHRGHFTATSPSQSQTPRTAH